MEFVEIGIYWVSNGDKIGDVFMCEGWEFCVSLDFIKSFFVGWCIYSVKSMNIFKELCVLFEKLRYN